MRITSDMSTDPTVAGQQVPLLNRDAQGNEIDWRTQYACTCPPTDDPNALPVCEGCIQLRGFLDRFRVDRRTRAATGERSSASRGTTRKARTRDEDIA